MLSKFIVYLKIYLNPQNQQKNGYSTKRLSSRFYYGTRDET